jgi:hypothetical protein
MAKRTNSAALKEIRKKFDSLLKNLNADPIHKFSSTAEKAYEAYTLSKIIKEYSNNCSGIANIKNPDGNLFLNQGPGFFHPNRCFKVLFNNGQEFFFGANIELWGLPACEFKKPIGDYFEADVVVIESKHEKEIIESYKRRPAPQHLHSIFECKYGSYNKGQIRELIGIRRHLSFIGPGLSITHSYPFNCIIGNCNPEIRIVLVRPRSIRFLKPVYRAFYALTQKKLII